MLPLGIRLDLTPKDRKVKRQLDKCRPRAYSDLIRSDIPGSLGVRPSCSPCSTSPLPLAMETSPGGPLAMKPTQGELRSRVKLLAKKRRSVQCKAHDPPDSSILAQGKVSKLGVSIPQSPVKERGSYAQVRVRGQALSSSAEVSEVVGVQHRSPSAAGAKGSSRRAVEPPLKVLPISI